MMGPVSSRMGEIFEFAVVGEGVDPMELRSVADWTIRYRLLGVEGVSFVLNLGGFVRQYQVLLNPEMLHHYGLTVGEVKEAVEQSNRTFSGGIITGKNQEFLIKGEGRIDSLAHIENTVIASRKNVPVFVKDVAEVKVAGKFCRGDAGFTGQEAVSVVVQKQYGGDTLRTISRLKEFLAEIQGRLAAGIKIVTYYDQSRLIESSLEHVGMAMLEGGVLVMLVILVFLGSLRASLIASLTIPLSILLSFVLMHGGDFADGDGVGRAGDRRGEDGRRLGDHGGEYPQAIPGCGGARFAGRGWPPRGQGDRFLPVFRQPDHRSGLPAAVGPGGNRREDVPADGVCPDRRFVRRPGHQSHAPAGADVVSPDGERGAAGIRLDVPGHGLLRLAAERRVSPQVGRASGRWPCWRWGACYPHLGSEFVPFLDEGRSSPRR